MPTSITQNNNEVSITQDKPIITVTDNNKGTSINVTQVDITTVSIATPGPKGDKGDNVFTAADNLTIQDITARNITASGDISSSGNIYSGIYYSYGKGLGVYSSVGNQLALSTGDVVTNINGTNIKLDAPVTASGNISASGNIYSDNHESIALSFQADGDGTNWYGPNKQGPYYYVYNFNYGNDTAVQTLDRTLVVAGIIIPYNAVVVGFRAIASNLTSPAITRVALYLGEPSPGTFDVTSGTASSLSITSLGSKVTDTPGAAENPMLITNLDINANVTAGSILYPRIKTDAAVSTNISMQILLKRRL